MNGNKPPPPPFSSPERKPSSPPSSISTQIVVGPASTPEEEALYAAAGSNAAAAAALARAVSPDTYHQYYHHLNYPSTTTTAASAEDDHDDRISPSGSNSSAGGEDDLGETNSGSFDGGLENMNQYPPSMTESVRAHVYEGGIRYHAYKAGKYAFPNDEIEQNRDDMKHSMTLLLMQGAFCYAPVDHVLERGDAEVLDLGESFLLFASGFKGMNSYGQRLGGAPMKTTFSGSAIAAPGTRALRKHDATSFSVSGRTTGTGTGIWAIELADKYPQATITGIDLSPIQPNYVPENVHFFVDDFDEDWVDPPNKYDFIHIRHTMHSIRDPKALFDRAMYHLKPGGYIEVQEIDIRPTSDDDSVSSTIPYALRDFLSFMEAGLRILGSEMHAIRKLPEELEEAGFTEITKKVHKAPIGMWPKDKRLRLCGLFLRTAMMDGLRGLSHRPLTALGWTQLQIEMVLVDVRKALMDPNVHAYFGFHAIYARKPFDAPAPVPAGNGITNANGAAVANEEVVNGKRQRESCPMSPRARQRRTSEPRGENGVP
ncbi:S-adenosyl-L-methionine-dependent methyltransferase [Podospora australis]|uniref:S-adenosyl-L-methionine-dependent methyltransferase n=1 Tax=Podospora australis TaxID=1536484 RepID=A0AAN6WK23_9PEZI|nr:S-adenosyl-L-methionine-dependent methyltransferase [Podospora australis]